MSAAGVLLSAVEDRTDPVGPAPVMDLWRAAEILTRLVQQHPDLVADLQMTAAAVDYARDYGSSGELCGAQYRLAVVQYDLIAASGELRELAAGGAR